MVCHRQPSQTCSSRIIIEAGDAYIELIEDYPCENREKLNRREGEIMRGRECVNRMIAGRTDKEWREANREALLAQQKIYREANREAVLAYHKIYDTANREDRNAKCRARRALQKAKSEATESPDS
jgi:hypothetical protein